MGLPELNQYQAAGKRLSSALPQRVGKEYRDRSLEEKIMSDKGVILDFGCKGTVSGSGTGPLDYGATGPVPDPEPRL